MDIVAVLPILGAFKSSDEVESLIKSAAKSSDEVVVDLGKHAENAGNIFKGFNQVESNIINEAQNIINSPEFKNIKAAHVTGKSVVVNINGRIIQYVPGLNASGMTMFGENGFLIGNEAFISDSELGKTMLYELYRLSTSSIAGGVSTDLAAQETMDAFDFVNRAIGELIK